MICITGINSSGTNWLSKLCYLALGGEGEFMVSVGGEEKFVIEPWSPLAQGYEEVHLYHPEYWDIAEGNVDLLGRWQGRNEAPASPDRMRISRALAAFEETFPEAAGFKTLYFHYWEIMREQWPDVKFVSIRRDLQGWLGSLARRRGLLMQIFGGTRTWTYGLPEDPPWLAMAKAAAEEGQTPEEWFPLLKAAYYRHVEYEWRDAHEPVESLRTSFGLLTGGWDLEAARILGHCGLPVPSDENLFQWGKAIRRRWADKDYQREDVFGVIELLRERGDCRCD